jgi:hypothetical protein
MGGTKKIETAQREINAINKKDAWKMLLKLKPG